MTPHVISLGDIMCCDILGYIDVIAIHVSVCVLDAIIVCVYRHACDIVLDVHNTVPVGLFICV